MLKKFGVSLLIGATVVGSGVMFNQEFKESLFNKIETVDMIMSNQKQSISEKQGLIEKLNNDLDNLRQEKEQLEEQIENSVSNEVANELREQINSLETQITELEQEKEEIMGQLEARDNEILRLENEVNEANNTLAQANTQLDNIINKYNEFNNDLEPYISNEFRADKRELIITINKDLNLGQGELRIKQYDKINSKTLITEKSSKTSDFSLISLADNRAYGGSDIVPKGQYKISFSQSAFLPCYEVDLILGQITEHYEI